MSWVCERCGSENLDDSVKECQACLQAKIPFYRKNLKTDDEVERDIFTISLNHDERAILERLKLLLNVKSDGKALKLGAKVGLNVLQTLFSEVDMRYISSSDRQRLSDFKKLPEPELRKL
jgi:hypothetical protein